MISLSLSSSGIEKAWAEKEIGIRSNFRETKTDRKRAFGAFDRFWSRQNPMHIAKIRADPNFPLSPSIYVPCVWSAFWYLFVPRPSGTRDTEAKGLRPLGIS